MGRQVRRQCRPASWQFWHGAWSRRQSKNAPLERHDQYWTEDSRSTGPKQGAKSEFGIQPGSGTEVLQELQKAPDERPSREGAIVVPVLAAALRVLVASTRHAMQKTPNRPSSKGAYIES